MKMKLFLLCVLATFSLTGYAQLSIGGTPLVYDKTTKTYMLTVPEEVFNSSYQASIEIDPGISNVKINGVAVTTEVVFPHIDASSNYLLRFTKNGRTTVSSIHFTYLPIMCITGTFSDDYVVAPVDFIFPDGQGVQHYRAKIKNAGESTNMQWVYKRNFHVKFVDDNGEKTDVSFFGFRNDNHWRLDAGCRDMIRFRNYAANGLWADLGTKSYYADKEPKAMSYIRGSHVEVFMNEKYHGFYNFTEFLDRKQMKLKKYKEITADGDSVPSSVEFHGMMWKTKSVTNETLFLQSSAPVDNEADNWSGYDLMYPEIEDVCPTDYSVMYNAVDFVAHSDDETFNSQVGEYFDLPVLVDYYMFLNVVFAIDNACTNMVWGCYDSAVDKKLTFAVWDMDATVGQHYSDTDSHYHADEIQPERELEDVRENWCKFSVNKLFKRLKTVPGFYRSVVNRYWQLRETVLQPDSLVARYQAIYDRLDACGALARETERWSGTDEIEDRPLEFEQEFEYLCDWLRRRIPYLDTHTFACQRGDVTGDGRVNITDVTMLLEYLLTEEQVEPFNDINADFNADDQLNITDVTGIIYQILTE